MPILHNNKNIDTFYKDLKCETIILPIIVMFLLETNKFNLNKLMFEHIIRS